MKKQKISRMLMTAASMIPVAAIGQTAERPNIVLINIDDMGYSDPSCYGGDYVETPNIDKLAEEGLSLRQFYTSCPISSPSRVGLTTGMFPTRWGINTFLQERANNARNEQNDFLLPNAPSMARALKESGYNTGHFGKWHMGGGRDVKNAPLITEYGFDEYASTWESPDPDPKLTSSNWIWSNTDEVKRWDRTAYFVDKTLDFLSRHKGEPCFVNLWPDDVHTPWVFDGDEASQRESAASFSIVLKELDRQIGRLMAGLKELGLDDNTLVIFTGDNGPAPSFDGHRTNSLRGQKGTLYEGGIRMPFIIRWPGVVPAGVENSKSVVCMVDLFPSLCQIAGAEVPTKYPLDGVDMSEVLLGKATTERDTPLFWEFGKTKADRISPHIGMRQGKWKLLVNADGSRTELYDMETDINEQFNVAGANPEVAAEMKAAAIAWFNEAYRQYADHVIRVSTDATEEGDGTSWDNPMTLSRALDEARSTSGAQIWMKEGVYTSENPFNVDNVKLYGGFAGTEQRLAERDWATHRTVIDGEGKHSCVRNSNLDATVSTELDGLILENGVNRADANGNGNGGGAILTNGATVRNCIFRNNRTQNGKNGGALHCHLGTVKVENTLFANNSSSGNGGAVQAGGGVTATLINCTLVNNKATGLSGGVGVGASNTNVNFYNVIAYGNEGKNGRESYAQNGGVNAGGAIVSKNSAIESNSTKFSDGNDENHVKLDADNAPGFENPGTTAGNCDAAEAEAASYRLTEGSPCIDAGNINLTSKTDRDLGAMPRLSGRQIDMGAYEYDNGAPVTDNPVYRVTPDGSADADGSDWSAPTTLDHAMQLASTAVENASIWLAEGKYTLENPLKIDKVEIYGGFAGNESSVSERDWAAHPTVLDGGGKVSAFRNQNLDAPVTSVVDGVTVQNCMNRSDANGNGNGAAALLTNGALVRNCIFRNNHTQGGKNGGAVHCQIGQVRIENCLFANNTSSGNGGALQIGGDATATVIHSTFVNNSASGLGGAIGTGTGTSALNLYNSVAYNNSGKNGRESYAQNQDINGGGKIVSHHSAVESTSTKFTDGNDVNHMPLSESTDALFENPAAVIGYGTSDAHVAAVESASYALAKGAPLIDAGDDNYASVSTYDLGHNQRLAGSHVDMGAYEYQHSDGIALSSAAEAGTIEVANGVVKAHGGAGELISVYTPDGKLIHRDLMKSDEQRLPFEGAGTVIIKIGKLTGKATL